MTNTKYKLLLKLSDNSYRVINVEDTIKDSGYTVVHLELDEELCDTVLIQLMCDNGRKYQSVPVEYKLYSGDTLNLFYEKESADGE